MTSVLEPPVQLPTDFFAHVGNAGIKDDTNDVVVVASARPCRSSAVFTQSRFAGPSVVISREHAAHGTLQCAVVVSKNANVATGELGELHAREVVTRVSALVGITEHDVLLASTGVIGRLYPMERLRDHLASISLPLPQTDAFAVATAMMTTDTVAKVAVAHVPTATQGTARIVGVAKGVGMIEPDMATMIALIFTDADVSQPDLDTAFRAVVRDTFNSLSIDTDTSTSDTAAIFANAAAGAVDVQEFTDALSAVCTSLTRQLARDGEGASKLLLVDVTGARDDEQARRVAKLVVNSPLVKTAVHGADPNWGRVAMAVGKASDDHDIDPDRVRICFGELELYPAQPNAADLEQLSRYLAGDEVVIAVDLGIADGSARAYGCDLSDQYVRINADYTT